MTPEEQRIAIAEFHDGWKRETRRKWAGAYGVLGWGKNKHLKLGDRNRYFTTSPSCFPDYPNDLNAIREAVMELRHRDRLKYAMMHKELERIVAIGNSIDDEHSWATADATAAQRAEAFLKTVGRWRE